MYIKRTVLRVTLLKYIFVALSKQRKNIRDFHEGQLSVVVVLLFYVHGKHLRSCGDGQLT